MAGIPAYIKPLSYIRGSGTQYITTGIYLRSTDVIKSKWRFENSAGNVYGCFTGSDADDNFCLYAGSASTNAYIRYNGQLVRDFKAVNGTIYNIEQGPDGFKAGSTTATFTASTFTCSAPMYLFMLPNSSSAKVTARFYGLRVYRDGALAYNFIPAQDNRNDEVGIWESVNGVWYSNAGTGEFTAGPEVAVALKSLLLMRRRGLMAAATHMEPVPGSDGKIWVYYNITSVDSASKILNDTTGISNTMNVDGVDVPRATTHQFSDVGVHLIKFGYTGQALKNTFSTGVVGIKEIYFPPNTHINSTRTNSPLYNKVPQIVRALGPIDAMPIAGSATATNINADFEINGLTSWPFGGLYYNCVKRIVVKGTFSSMPGYDINGFNATNDFRFVWIESPNLTTCNKSFFKNMGQLEVLVMNVPTPPSFSDSSGFFQNSNSSFRLYVPYSSDHSILDAYKAASVWSNRASQMLELNPDGTIPE